MAMVLVVEEKPTYWQLSVSGELGYAECSEFRLSVHRILMSLTRVTLVDMSGIEYVDSSGLGILVAMSRE
jgi:anti-anti-sigma factor